MKSVYKYILFLFIALMNLVSGFAQVNNWFYQQLLNGVYKENVNLLSIDSFANEMKDFIVFDSRSNEEFDISHIENAQFIDYDNYEAYDFSTIRSDQKILVYCSIGARSQTVAEHLVKNGFTNVYNLEGGIFEWVNQNKIIYNIAGETTENIHAFSKAWGIWLQKGNKVY